MTETNKRRLKGTRGMRKTKYGGLRSTVRKTRRGRSFFGLGNRRQETEANIEVAEVAAMAAIPLGGRRRTQKK